MIARKEDQMFDKDTDTQADSPESRDGTALGSTALGSTSVDLIRLGLNQIAYILRARINDVPVWSIHSASGDPIGAADSFDRAWVAVRQHDMEPLRVH
jgi:hypothetical protein